MICTKYRHLDEGKTLLFLSLQIGFCHQDPQQQQLGSGLIHPRYHESMVDVVFGSQQDEVIADFLYFWTSGIFHITPHTSLAMCARHLADLPNLSSASPRLRRLVVRTIGLIGYQGFEKVGVESFIGLLDRLDVSVNDVDSKSKWTILLLGVIKSPEARDRLSYSYWELLLELCPSSRLEFPRAPDYDPHIMTSLHAAQEWDKLACWICVVWVEWPPYAKRLSRDLGRVMLSLFRQRPDSLQKFEEWWERKRKCIPVAFQRIYERGLLEVKRRGAPP